MKYAIIAVTNGNYNIHTEHSTVQSAKVEFHNYCAALWNDSATTTATIMIADENLDAVEGYKEHIVHPAPSEPTA